jgi:hypothetical protein
MLPFVQSAAWNDLIKIRASGGENASAARIGSEDGTKEMVPQVTFLWRDSAHNNEQKPLTLSLDKFLRRFPLHILPQGFVRIRHFGLLVCRQRSATLPLCFQLWVRHKKRLPRSILLPPQTLGSLSLSQV